MTRRLMIRVLLSLLLLVSQQMAIAHVITHWSGQRNANVEQMQERDDGVSKAFAKERLCDQCLAFAQIAGAIGSGTRSFVPPALAAAAFSHFEDRAVTARTVVPFLSRGPPAAA
jgi:hypothetical protein